MVNFFAGYGRVTIAAERSDELTVAADGQRAQMSMASAVRMAQRILAWDKECGPGEPRPDKVHRALVSG